MGALLRNQIYHRLTPIYFTLKICTLHINPCHFDASSQTISIDASRRFIYSYR